MNLADNQFVRW